MTTRELSPSPGELDTIRDDAVARERTLRLGGAPPVHEWDRYDILALLGRGGMGSVYEAVHIHTEKRVAVKLLSPQLSKDLKLVARFQREAKAASRLEHENCVHVDDFGEDADGTFYIAMEFIEGHGLADELRKSGPMPPDRVARIAAQLLKALDAAHSAGVLHRDLKPQNVMLMQKPSRPDIVKVVDFGIAKITTNSVEDQGALTVPGTIFGTPEYMSPEQARGEALDVRSDLYSASVVCWHMLLGRSPFRGTSVRETLMKVFTDEPPLPSLERPTVSMPPGFEKTLLKAMAKRKEDRYPDAASFLEALRPFVTGSQVEVPRRPLPGLAPEGGVAPATLDDHRAATLALPEAELAPLDKPPAPPSPPSPATPPAPPMKLDLKTKVASISEFNREAAALDAHRSAVASGASGASPAAASAAAPRVVTIEALEKAPAAPAAKAPAAHELHRARRRRRLSPAAVLVLVIAGLGAVALVGAAVTVVYLVEHGFFDDKNGKVVDVVPKDKVTNTEIDEKRPPPPVIVDPVARDEGLRRAETALEKGDIVGARVGYQDAFNADDQSAKALTGLATMAMQQHDYKAACSAFEKLMALDARYARQFGPMYQRAKKLRDEP